MKSTKKIKKGQIEGLDELTTLVAGKQNILVAGTNITIDNTNPLLSVISASGGGGASETNLGYTPSPTNGIVTSDTGNDATIPLANGTNAGLITPSQFTKLSNLSGVNTGDITLTTIGTSGASTLIGSTLNIPDYTGNNNWTKTGDDIRNNNIGNTQIKIPTTKQVQFFNSADTQVGFIDENGTYRAGTATQYVTVGLLGGNTWMSMVRLQASMGMILGNPQISQPFFYTSTNYFGTSYIAGSNEVSGSALAEHSFNIGNSVGDGITSGIFRIGRTRLQSTVPVKYATDLSGSYDDRTLVDKGYINNSLSGYLTSATAALTYEPIKGSDDNYVTDAEKIVIGNTSGTNTGDQQLIYPVTETGTSFSLTDAHNGKITILTASCTVTIPNGLIAGFEHTIVTLAGVTLTVALGGSVTLFNNAGTTMAEKLSCTIKNRTATNQYITAGNL